MMNNLINKVVLSVLLAFSIILTNCFAAKIEESIFVHSKDPKFLKLLTANPELIVDHPTSYGFELYGPIGTKEWLENIEVSYSDLNDADHLKGMDGEEIFADYPTHEELTKTLQKIAAEFPQIAKLYSIGKSVQGRELWVMKISDNVQQDEIEPEFKYISSMHGDEITGRELTTFLVKDLVKAYGKDREMTELIDNTEIFIMPSMNPDGSKLRQRANARGYDLNRNFPDWIKNEPNSSSNREVETSAIMAFQARRHFSLSANFHGGAVVVNYPWDSTYKLHPLDGLVKNLSLQYADLNPAMRNSTEFSRGVTNGADWYVLYGGMQDWSYIWHNDLQVTVELSDTKWPRYSEIPSFYDDNKEAMLLYAKKVHQGAGFKFNTRNKTGSVEIFSNGMSMGTFGFFNGEFFKVLDTGDYTFVVKSGGHSYNFDIAVEDSITQNGRFVLLN